MLISASLEIIESKSLRLLVSLRQNPAHPRQRRRHSADSRQWITGAQYRYTYRSSATGATSNPSPASGEEHYLFSPTKSLQPPPTIRKWTRIDFYRLDTATFHYVESGARIQTVEVDLVHLRIVGGVAMTLLREQIMFPRRTREKDSRSPL